MDEKQIKGIDHTEGQHKRGNIVAKAKWRPGLKNDFGKYQKHFLLSRPRFCMLGICCVGAQTRKHLGNTEEKMTSNVFRLFPRLRTQGTYFEDAKFVSRKQKMFCFLPVCSLLQQCEQHWLQMFLQQCFLVYADLKRTQLNMNDFHLNS